jgi:hypothetical protein
MRASGPVGCGPIDPHNRDLLERSAIEEQVRAFALAAGDHHGARPPGDDPLGERSPIPVAAGEDAGFVKVRRDDGCEGKQRSDQGFDGAGVEQDRAGTGGQHGVDDERRGMTCEEGGDGDDDVG